MTYPYVTAAANNSAYDVSANQWNAVVKGVKNQSYSYLIYTDGAGNYYAKNGATGEVEFTSQNLVSGVLQPCQNLLTHGGKIIVQQVPVSMSWESQFNITNPHIDFSAHFGWHEASCFLATNTMTSMIYITAKGVSIHDCGFSGDNKAGNGVKLASSVGDECILRDLHFARMTNAGVEMLSSFNQMERATIDYCGYGVSNEGNYNYFSLVNCLGNSLNWRIAYGQQGKYVGCSGDSSTGNNGGWLFSASNYNQLSACSANTNNRYGIWLASSSNNTLNNIQCKDNSQAADNTYSAIYISGTSILNSINMQVFTSSPSLTVKYGIEENGASADYNIVSSGSVFAGCGTGVNYTVGVNSKLLPSDAMIK